MKIENRKKSYKIPLTFPQHFRPKLMKFTNLSHPFTNSNQNAPFLYRLQGLHCFESHSIPTPDYVSTCTYEQLCLIFIFEATFQVIRKMKKRQKSSKIPLIFSEDFRPKIMKFANLSQPFTASNKKPQELYHLQDL